MLWTMFADSGLPWDAKVAGASTDPNRPRCFNRSPLPVPLLSSPPSLPSSLLCSSPLTSHPREDAHDGGLSNLEQANPSHVPYSQYATHVVLLVS